MSLHRTRSSLLRIVLPIVLLLVMMSGIAPGVTRANTLPTSMPARNSSMPALNDADFKPDVIYQVVLDRFFDGDPTNNDPPGDKGLYDPTKTNWKKYWGGDLAGLTQKLPYIAGMGVNAIWISPAVENVHKLVNGTDAGYHGYWARDFYRIDPILVPGPILTSLSLLLIHSASKLLSTSQQITPIPMIRANLAIFTKMVFSSRRIIMISTTGITTMALRLIRMISITLNTSISTTFPILHRKILLSIVI